MRVYVGIGSNIDRERNVRAALLELRARFGELAQSPVYESPAEGFVGEPFFNLVVGFDTDLPVDALRAQLREIEVVHGRDPAAHGFVARTLDLDLLLYGERVDATLKLPHPDILKYPFVLKPFSELVPTLRHPVAGRALVELWCDAGLEDGRLRRVEFAM
ncbi:MAG: 2-amino-4-hydroxy-6-hydroxymethyldihydropteridine diphosphokinase [Chromatiales bacterium]|jgi:2-amino-4-hydroxy-6-hydroxymethyldihydropteridine diphosphokinase|nr:2-amino-4-hydroxy-6-hydroxymethyldihydropteridine diphosphokinase [Chromatiales bacterium]MDX9766942.1 2-amino-4-hydroxy-6-hydroxymethyldihydropteridine diphosphokinase [Ectothiorhodospiraceae bacterium]